MALQEVPLVSVIICYLNEATFLTEAVESVLQQNYVRWELLLVDDGSTDNSVAIAKAFAGQYPDKIQYLEHQNHANKGLSASRNSGITKSRGDLLAFLDADDVWLSDKLTQQVAVMQQHPDVAMLCEASEYWFSWADPAKKNVFQPIGAAAGRVYDPPQLLFKLYPLGQGAAPCPSGLMVRKALLNNNYFEESFKGIYAMYEDQAFLSKIYLHQKVYVSAACTNRYRQRIGSIVQTVHDTGFYHTVRIFYLNWFQSYLNACRITDRRIRCSVWKARLPYRYLLLYQIITKVFYKIMYYTKSFV